MADILANIISHDVRRGSLRDLANIRPSNLVIGIATKEVARMAEYSAESYRSSTTDKYIGDVERDTFSARAEQIFAGRKAPAIGNKYEKKRLTYIKITTYCKENNIDSISKNGRQKAGEALYRKQKAD